MSHDEAIQRAVALIKTGDRDGARQVLQDLLRQDRDNLAGWQGMARLANDEKEAIFCLKQILRLDPGNQWATEQLARLEPPAQAIEVPPSAPPAASPPAERAEIYRIAPAEDRPAAMPETPPEIITPSSTYSSSVKWKSQKKRGCLGGIGLYVLGGALVLLIIGSMLVFRQMTALGTIGEAGEGSGLPGLMVQGQMNEAIVALTQAVEGPPAESGPHPTLPPVDKTRPAGMSFKISNMGEIEYLSMLTRNFESEDEAHNYSFYGTGNEYAMILVQSDGTSDPEVLLYDSSNQIIANNDDLDNTTRNAVIEMTLPYTGPYTIQVRNFTAGFYTLSVWKDPESMFGAE
ncbi:MAG: tetratricopeptide repeat protein [Anaerolineae bacterium]|nr:tetratricopeptide repeat protein [Anaerolineae bacterium]